MQTGTLYFDGRRRAWPIRSCGRNNGKSVSVRNHRQPLHNFLARRGLGRAGGDCRRGGRVRKRVDVLARQRKEDGRAGVADVDTGVSPKRGGR